MHPLDDTIAAIASAPGGAARGIVRLSGPGVLACLRAVFSRRSALPANADSLVVSRAATAICGSFRLPDLASPLPGELYLWPAGRSYTGEPVAEIHTLGSPPLLEELLAALCAAGARLAEPGEFTLRAFLAGRIDLTQAEAVLGVIDAADPRPTARRPGPTGRRAGRAAAPAPRAVARPAGPPRGRFRFRRRRPAVHHGRAVEPATRRGDRRTWRDLSGRWPRAAKPARRFGPC